MLRRVLFKSVFVPESFGAGFALVRDWAASSGSAVMGPEPSLQSRDAMMSWVDTLPAVVSPVWLGLAATSENRLLMTKASVFATTARVGI